MYMGQVREERGSGTGGVLRSRPLEPLESLELGDIALSTTTIVCYYFVFIIFSQNTLIPGVLGVSIVFTYINSK